MLKEIHLPQIRISDSKREKVYAVCPCLLFKQSDRVFNSNIHKTEAMKFCVGDIEAAKFG